MSWIAPALSLALVGCGAGQDAQVGGEEQTARSEEVSAEWTLVAPGVWERARPDGVREQMGIGVQAMERELQRIRVERALRGQVNAMSGTPATRLDESDKRIDFLERNLAAVRERGVSEETPDEGALRSALGGSEGTPSGAFCAGNYSFEVDFDYSMAGGSVTTRATWSEFGPFAPYTKEMYVYAAGWDSTLPLHSTYNSTGPFMGTCCKSVETSATAYPTFNPLLEGSGYIFGSSGCEAPRYYRAWNY